MSDFVISRVFSWHNTGGRLLMRRTTITQYAALAGALAVTTAAMILLLADRSSGLSIARSKALADAIVFQKDKPGEIKHERNRETGVGETERRSPDSKPA